MTKQVSVIMPAFNAEKTIRNAILSVLRNPECAELLVVDDGSTDETPKVVQSITDERLRQLTLEKNYGVSFARNAGIEAARFDYIGFCDADDEWLHDKLRAQLTDLNAGWPVSGTGMLVSGPHGRPRRPVLPPEIITADMMRTRNWIPNSTGVYSSRRTGKIFQENIRHEDYVMWHEIVRIAGAAKVIQRPLAIRHVHEGNLTRNKAKSLYWHLRAQRRIGLSNGEILKYLVLNIGSRLAK